MIPLPKLRRDVESINK